MEATGFPRETSVFNQVQEERWAAACSLEQVFPRPRSMCMCVCSNECVSTFVCGGEYVFEWVYVCVPVGVFVGV